MKTKHNKKRNSAFIYEALIREATVASMRGDTDKRNKVVKLVKKHFRPGGLLRKDLECYQSLHRGQNINEDQSEKIIKEAKIAQRLIDPNGLFKAQTSLIGDVNKELSPSVFANFVPNYRSLATIAQLFSGQPSPRRTVEIEHHIIQEMAQPIPTEITATAVDDIVFRKFVGKFNSKYSEELIKEQKQLLSYYVTSVSDNAVELKMYLNEEINRLKNKVLEARELPEVKKDEDMVDKTNKVIEKLDALAQQNINESALLTVMKTQKLVKEIYNNVDSN
jgi:hypothetical protein